MMMLNYEDGWGCLITVLVMGSELLFLLSPFLDEWHTLSSNLTDLNHVKFLNWEKSVIKLLDLGIK